MSLKQPVVCQIVGCANVGKTKLLAAYSGINVLSAVDMNGFPIKSQPYEYGMAIARGIIDENGQPTHISIWDAPLGNEKLRPLTLTKADVVLLCYSTDAIITLHTACQEWHALLSQHCPTAPIIAVGIRQSSSETAKAAEMAAEGGSAGSNASEKALHDVGARLHLQCCLKDAESVQHVFTTAARIARANCEAKSERASCSMQ
eukprot:TRINITY_DN8865_c0_g1_i4.p1 TRINITY_DN8865_c0_g1~~TRINITY_DN8865_c0_g1_i4.p1  ORF type:complete len:203 (+),score=40.74 TRINITY_DN8865_c0_g1_i4:107-715(+)